MLSANSIVLIILGILFLVVGYLFQTKRLDWAISITGFNSETLRKYKNASKIRIVKALSVYLAGGCLLFAVLFSQPRLFIMIALGILILADIIMVFLKR